MKILFVEDHQTFGESIAEDLRRVAGVILVDLVRSRDSALAAIRDSFYDLLVLDLSIPATDTDLDTARENGQAVFYFAIDKSPGMPIFILTGSEMDSFTKSLAKHGEKLDLWGSAQPTNTLDYFEKESVDDLLVEVSRISSEVAKVNAIALNFRGRNLNLSAGSLRCIQVAARRMRASSVEVVSLGDGMSSARVIRATMSNSLGKMIHATAAKLGKVDEIKIEIEAYNADAKRLPVGLYPTLTEIVDKGACGSSGIFYTLAADFGKCLFDVLASDDSAAAGVIESLRGQMAIWTDASERRRVTFSEVRKRVVWDATFEDLTQRHGLNLADIESVELEANFCCVHGDLHGANLLVSMQNRPLLIDFGDVGPGSACIDPITLELSAIFHPDAIRNGISGKLLPNIDVWANRDAFERVSAFPKFSNACREWAYDLAGTDLNFMATSYACVLRQLRFGTVDTQITLRLLDSICARVRGG